ncbi:MAG: sugar ABC transporter substrate-binding protein [Betaproteobacteria bacterium HGW-Betaproteobacteria-7]|jgi:ribose transport system substrate-binding protein|nr:MAG: sugar ABC transporter substrate-binding protein [Betaproteobacteria bacterium HGW-Betaproteobacteria-7]
MFVRFLATLLLAGGLGFSSATVGAQPARPDAIPMPVALDEMRRVVESASQPGAPWGGPTAGPAGQPEKIIALVCEDLRNGGILGVAKGVQEATSIMGWSIRVFDAGGTPDGRRKSLADAFAAKPDGVILVGGDAMAQRTNLLPFARKRIPIVGWHVGPQAGTLREGPVAMNVSTDPIEVARVTAMAAVSAAKGKAGVVIFTDSNFAIALAKSEAMAKIIKACPECTLLEVRDLAISRSTEQVPGVTRQLLTTHGERWTHALAINDIYFDYAVPELTRAGLLSDRLQLLSAGDGSAAAFTRIRARAFQTATVAEPLNLHGWQLVDELNRLLAGQPVSGYVIPVHLVTGSNVHYDGGPHFRYDPDNGYREIYRRIWKR